MAAKKKMWISNDLHTIHFLLDKQGWGKHTKDDEGNETGKEDVKNVIPITNKELKYLQKNLQNVKLHDDKTINKAQKHLSELRRLRGENWDDDDVRNRAQVVRKSIITTFKGQKTGQGSPKKRKLKKKKKKLTKAGRAGKNIKKKLVAGSKGKTGVAARKGALKKFLSPHFIPKSMPSMPVIPGKAPAKVAEEPKQQSYLYDMLSDIQHKLTTDFSSGIKKTSGFAKTLTSSLPLPKPLKQGVNLGIDAMNWLGQTALKSWNSPQASNIFKKLKDYNVDTVAAGAALMQGLNNQNLPEIAASLTALATRHPLSFLGIAGAGLFGNTLTPILKAGLTATPQALQDIYHGKSLIESVSSTLAKAAIDSSLGFAQDIGEHAWDVAAGVGNEFASRFAADSSLIQEPTELMQSPTSPFYSTFGSPTASDYGGLSYGQMAAGGAALGGLAYGASAINNWMKKEEPRATFVANAENDEVLDLVRNYQFNYNHKMFPSDNELQAYKRHGKWPDKIPYHKLLMQGYSNNVNKIVIPEKGYSEVDELFQRNPDARSYFSPYNAIFQYRKAKQLRNAHFAVVDMDDLQYEDRIAQERNQFDAWKSRINRSGIDLGFGYTVHDLQSRNVEDWDNFSFTPKRQKTPKAPRAPSKFRRAATAALNSAPYLMGGAAAGAAATFLPAPVAAIMGTASNVLNSEAVKKGISSFMTSATPAADKEGEGYSIYDEKIENVPDEDMDIFNNLFDLGSLEDLDINDNLFVMHRKAQGQDKISSFAFRNKNLADVLYESSINNSPTNSDAKYTSQRISTFPDEPKNYWNNLLSQGIPLYADGFGTRFGNLNLPSSLEKMGKGFAGSDDTSWDVDLMRLFNETSLRPQHIKMILPGENGYYVGGVYRLKDISKIISSM